MWLKLRDVAFGGAGLFFGSLFTIMMDVMFKPDLEVAWSWAKRQVNSNNVTFESTEISGCSGGALKRLLADAKIEGMRIDGENVVQNALLCQRWRRTAPPKSILEHMATKFDQCFTLDSKEQIFALRRGTAALCKTDFVVDDKTNEWVRQDGRETILCVRTNSTSRPSRVDMRYCDPNELKSLGFPISSSLKR